MDTDARFRLRGSLRSGASDSSALASRRPHAQRLLNTGNSCFLNSVVQALSSIAPLHAYTHRIVHRTKMGAEPEIVMSRRTPMAFYLLCTLRDLVVPIGDAIRPRMSDLKILQERFLTGQQQDAHEFLSFVLEQLESECLCPVPLEDTTKLALAAPSSDKLSQMSRLQSRRAALNTIAKRTAARAGPQRRPNNTNAQAHLVSRGSPGLMFVNAGAPRLPAGPVWWRPSPRPSSDNLETIAPKLQPISTPALSPPARRLLHLDNPLSGLLESTLYCPYCDREWSTMQKMLNLSLYTPMGQRTTSTTLEECLKAFAAPEEVDGVFCSGCNQKRTLLKRLTIARAPHVLCLHLHRIHATSTTFGSAPSLRKTTTHIHFPLHLSVAPYMSSFVGSFSRPAPRGSLPHRPSRGVSHALYRTDDISAEIEVDAERSKSVASCVVFSLLGTTYTPPAQWRNNGSPLPQRPQPLSRTSSQNSLGDLVTPDVSELEERDYEHALLPNPTLNVRPDFSSGKEWSTVTSRMLVENPKRVAVSPSYVLSAVIVHIGSETGGHYIAYKRLDPALHFTSMHDYDSRMNQLSSSSPSAASAQWIRISDDHYEVVDEASVLRSEAYMLFYTQVKAK